jgi:tripartite ATP-independent transporter DctM subunit
MTTLVIAVICFTFMFLGMPVAFSIGVASLGFFMFSDFVPLSISVQKIAAATQSFPLLAVPLFIVAGNLMNATGITARLVALANALTGWLAGGLAQVSIVLSALMGGVSGSAVADAAMQARILGPAMIKQGYAKGYACAVISVGSLITATIPPSLGLILYGFLGNVSIGKLFVGGIVPGLLMTLILMGIAFLIAKRRGYVAGTDQRPTGREVLRQLNASKFALLFPILLIVGIRYGIFTPSEAGAFAVAYAIFIGVFAYRELTVAAFRKALHQSVSDIGVIMLIIMFSSMVGYVIALDQVPQGAARFILSLTSNREVLMGCMVLLLFVMGMFLEATVITLLLTPILVPVVTRLGIDPVHFGLVMMTTVTFGCMTPPVGTAMYAVCGLLRCRMDDYTREAIPLFAGVLALIVVMIVWPDLVLVLPNLLM